MSKSPTSPPVVQPEIDLGDAEAAYDHVKPRIEALAPADVKPLRFDLRIGAIEGFKMAQYARDPARRFRFERLARVEEFHLPHLDDLASFALAGWWVRHKLSTAAALHSEAQVPAELVTDADALKTTMFRVLGFHYDEDSPEGRLLAYYRQGTGHQDRADDLFGLADLYKEKKADLAGTPRHYDPKDEQKARRIARRILAELAKSEASNYAVWSDRQNRVATMFETHFVETQRTGEFLFGKDPLALRMFPRLYSVARGGGGSTKGTEEPATPEAPAAEGTPPDETGK